MAVKMLVAALMVAGCSAFTQSPVLASRSKLAASKLAPQMSLEVAPTSLEQVSSALAGVVAVDGGTIGLDVQFGAFLAVILGTFIPVVFLITLFIQSEAQGTATTFRQPDSIGGTRFEDE
jgi:photosystem II PsbM protein|mmetsp:Transcript_14711/g.33805  ORF Transcript_14711/g.33805 Transcript_14711/m.33805 type:complete len:120 (-) Transcript_14711:283-642(-)|eukprot:Transcript_28888.p3 GENE.Transcript_28888~~Transcript_28888.p3  ORF type:complete len:120 (+),score=33.28 Transcript_28888:332-691(+)